MTNLKNGIIKLNRKLIVLIYYEILKETRKLNTPTYENIKWIMSKFCF